MTMSGGSKHSIAEATRSRAKFSGHGASKGAAGFVDPLSESDTASFLSKAGETAIVNPPKGGMKNFEIGAAWDRVPVEEEKPAGFLGRFLGKTVTQITQARVDLDVGCLYELKNGRRGAIQAFGKMFGALNEEPYIKLSGDERTGDTEGEDEVIRINGAHWNDIARILIYVYIYKGAENWMSVRPQIQVRVPGESPMIVTLRASRRELPLCAVASLENVRGGIRLTNHLEYYPGHDEMDRAFGFGLEWADGQKM